jgi:hypothetical protein
MRLKSSEIELIPRRFQRDSSGVEENFEWDFRCHQKRIRKEFTNDSKEF